MVVDSKLWFSNVLSLSESEKSWPQILAIVIGCLSSLNNGLLFSWASPFLPKITKDKETYNISEHEASHFNTIQPVTMILCCTISTKFSDTFGRKKALLLVTVPQLLAWITAALATNVYVFYASRVCAGISDSIVFTILPVYIGEISSPKIRGTWGNALVTSIQIGQLLINILGANFSVEDTSYICIPLPVIFFILFSQMPESPCYYLMKNMDEETKASLRYLQRKQNVEEEFLSLKKDVERQMSESGTWRDLWIIDSNRKALISGIFLRSSQQLSGINVFLVYTQYIFEKSGSNVSSELSSILFAAFSLFLNLFVVVLVIHRLSYRMCYIVSSFFCALILLSMSIYFYFDQYQPDVNLEFFNWIPLTGMLGFQVFCTFGITVIPTLMLGEIFSASIKAKAMTIVMFNFGIMLVLANNLFYTLNSHLGLFAPFLLFGLCTTASGGLAIKLIPETREKTLEEIQQSLKK